MRYKIQILLLGIIGLFGCSHVDPYVRKAKLHPEDQSTQYTNLIKLVVKAWDTHPRSIKLKSRCKDWVPERLVVYTVPNEEKLKDIFEYLNGHRPSELNGFVSTSNSYYYMYFVDGTLISRQRIFVWEYLRILTLCMDLMDLDDPNWKSGYSKISKWIFKDKDSIKAIVYGSIGLIDH